MNKIFLVILLLAFHASSLSQTELHTAASQSDLRQVRQLIATGADLDARDEFGQTPLMYAIDAGANLSVVRALVRAGADVNATTDANWTALHYAVREDSISHMRLLFAAGVTFEDSTAAADAPQASQLNNGTIAWLLLGMLRQGVTIAGAFLIYLLLLHRFVSNPLTRLITRSTPPPLHVWHSVQNWGNNTATTTHSRAFVLQPVVASISAVILALICSLVIAPSLSAITAVQLGLWALLITFSLVHAIRRFADRRQNLRGPLPAHLNPLDGIVRALNPGWHFYLNEQYVFLSHEEVPNRQYLLVHTPATGDLQFNEQGRLNNDQVGSLLSELGPNKENLKHIIFAPQASAHAVNDRLITGHGLVFCGDNSSLSEQLEAWHLTHLGAKRASDRGREVEASALEEAKRVLPSDWKLHPGYLMETEGADIDLLIRLPGGECYNVDIKSHRGDPRNSSSNKQWQDTIDQVMRQSREVHGRPVVWQPEAQRNEAVITVSNVMFIAGNAAVLRDALTQRSGHNAGN